METHRRCTIPAPLVLLGAASYAIYLVHGPLQSLVARLLQGADHWGLTFAACCVASLAAGLAYHVGYERPVLRRLARRGPPAP